MLKYSSYVIPAFVVILLIVSLLKKSGSFVVTEYAV